MRVKCISIFVLLIIFSSIIPSVRSMNMDSVNYYLVTYYPYDSNYLFFEGYAVADYDNDGVSEILIPLVKTNGYFVRGVLFIIDNEGDKNIYFEDLYPCKVFYINGRILVIGYFPFNNTYGLIVLDRDLDIINKSLLNISLNESSGSLIVVPRDPLVLGEKIYFTLNIVSKNVSQAYLMEYDLARNILKSDFSIKDLTINSNPININGYILWGTLIFNDNMSVLYNLSKYIWNNLHDTIYYILDYKIYGSKLYMIVVRTYGFSILVFDTSNYRYEREIPLDFPIAEYSKMFYVENKYYIYFLAGNISNTGTDYYGIVELSSLDINKYTVSRILYEKGGFYQPVSTTYDRNYVYIIINNTLYIYNPENNAMIQYNITLPSIFNIPIESETITFYGKKYLYLFDYDKLVIIPLYNKNIEINVANESIFISPVLLTTFISIMYIYQLGRLKKQ